MFALSLKNILKGFTPSLVRPLWARLEASPLGSRLARGAFWSLTGTAISRSLSVVASIFVARMLGKVGFGELGIIQSSITMFGTFAGFGLGLTATKHVAEFRSKDPARAGRIVGLSSVVSWVTGSAMAVALFVLSPWLSTNTLAAPQLSGLLRIGALLILLSAINGAQTGALAGFEAFRRIASISLVAGMATFPLVVGGALWRGLEGVLLGLAASQAVTCFLNFHGLRAEARCARVPLTYKGLSREWIVLWRFSLPALIGNLLVGPAYWLCSIMLVNTSDGYAQMGLFNAANQWFAALLFLPGILGQAALPVFSEIVSGNDGVKSRKVFAFYIKLNAAVVAPLVFLGCLASPLIMSTYGAGFREAWPTLIVVLITAALFAVQVPIGQVIAASGRMWLGSALNFGWAVCFVLLAWVLLPWGAFGLAGARLVAYMVLTLLTFPFAALLLKGTK
jgi:O-antigen/teichoic acid export membrane protein